MDAEMDCPPAENFLMQHCSMDYFMQLLDLDAGVEDDGLVMAAVKHMYSLPLPHGWSAEMDEESKSTFFYDVLTGESSWFHPQEQLFKDILAEVQSWLANEPMQCLISRVQANLQQAHQLALSESQQWMRVPCDPHEYGQSEYYVNRSTSATGWTDPRESLEFDLQQRVSVLCRCVEAHEDKYGEAAKGACNPRTPMSLLPTPGRKRCLPRHPPSLDSQAAPIMEETQGESLSSRLASRFAAELRLTLNPVQRNSPQNVFTPSARTSSGKGTDSDTGRSSESSASTCPGSGSSDPTSRPSTESRSNSRSVPALELDPVDTEQIAPPAPSILRRPPTTPCRWFAHARFVNSQLRSENDELQLLLMQLKRNLKKMQSLEHADKDDASASASMKVLKAEQAALAQRAKCCLAHSTAALKRPTSDDVRGRLPPPTPPPARVLTPKFSLAAA
eukprot:TRINITY_DN21986_c0_g1_i1.p1 TRINITY_DN21986_c0_g1~~TRINITY_DN21986_c0_g1_i1.p1  ORF type:complete len:447 (+),score=93.21 TRINITY_DN21986_c0_g1_i1:59-1399(+)